MVLMNVSTATSPPNFMSSVRCSRNEQLARTLHPEQQFNQDGGKESVKDWRFFFLSGNTRSMIYCINHSACGGEKMLYSPFLYDDPNLPPSPPVPADSNGGEAKQKAMFSGFHFVHQHYSVLRAGRWEWGGWWGDGPVYSYLFHLDVLSSAAGLAALQWAH